MANSIRAYPLIAGGLWIRHCGKSLEDFNPAICRGGNELETVFWQSREAATRAFSRRQRWSGHGQTVEKPGRRESENEGVEQMMNTPNEQQPELNQAGSAQVARQFWRTAGCQTARDEAYWLKAERQILAASQSDFGARKNETAALRNRSKLLAFIDSQPPSCSRSRFLNWWFQAGLKIKAVTNNP